MVVANAARVLLPDAAMAVSVIALFLALLMGDGPAKFFRDSDTGWHIRTGESILAANPMPRSDPYSYTKPGQPWFAWEWASDVLMGAAHRRFGLPGVALLFATGAAVAVWLWFQLHWMAGGNFFFACAMAYLLLNALQLHLLARPHVFSWTLALLAVMLSRTGSRPVHYIAALALGTVWANLHASFFLLPAILLSQSLGALLTRALWNRETNPSHPAILALLATAGTFVNPYGASLHQHVLAYLANEDLLSRVAEFQSFNFHAQGALPITIAVLLTMSGAVLAWGNKQPGDALLCLALAALSLRSARTIPLAALIALPLANGALTAALARMDLAPRVRAALDAFLAYSQRLRLLEKQAGGWLLAPAALALAFVIMHAPALQAKAAFPATEFPVEAAAAVEQLPVDARILAPDKFGGYLIYRFRGTRKVFFDGRSDFYGAGFMKEYIDLIEARPGWRNHMSKYGFTHALLPNRYTLVDALQAQGWTPLHKDKTATLLQRPAQEP